MNFQEDHRHHISSLGCTEEELFSHYNSCRSTAVPFTSTEGILGQSGQDDVMRTEVKVRLQAGMVPAGKRPDHLRESCVIKAVMATRKCCQLPKDIERSWEMKVTYLLLRRKAGPLPIPHREPAASPCSPAPAASYQIVRQGKGIVIVKRRKNNSTNVAEGKSGHRRGKRHSRAEAPQQAPGSAAGNSMKTEALPNNSRSSIPIYLEIKPWYVNSLRSRKKVKQNS